MTGESQFSEASRHARRSGRLGRAFIGAVDRWPKLSAVVFDTASVCEGTIDEGLSAANRYLSCRGAVRRSHPDAAFPEGRWPDSRARALLLVCACTEVVSHKTRSVPASEARSRNHKAHGVCLYVKTYRIKSISYQNNIVLLHSSITAD